MRKPGEVLDWMHEYSHEEEPGNSVAHDFTFTCYECIRRLIEFIAKGQ